MRRESLLEPESPVFFDDVSSPCHETKALRLAAGDQFLAGVTTQG